MIMYADGSAYLADQSGGWAWWVSDELNSSGYVNPATNNTMELQAVIEGLQILEWEWDDDGPLEVVSDSRYVIDGMTKQWYVGWRRRGWVSATGEPVKNQGLWKQLIDVAERWPRPIVWTHVRGHGRGPNDPPHHVRGNDIVDKMASAARKSGGFGETAARRAAIAAPSKPPRKVTMTQLEPMTFWVNGQEYAATSIHGQDVILEARRTGVEPATTGFGDQRSTS